MRIWLMKICTNWVRDEANTQQDRSSLVFQGVSATPAPPFYLHESINVQIKLFIKVEGAPGEVLTVTNNGGRFRST